VAALVTIADRRNSPRKCTVKRRLSALSAFIFLEESRHRAQHRSLPLAELIGMGAVFGSDLGQGLVVAQDLSNDLSLENGGETSACWKICHNREPFVGTPYFSHFTV